MQQKMAAQVAKQAGYKSLGQVSELSGVSRQTLVNWYQNKRRLFDIVILGTRQFDSQSQPPAGQPAERSES